MSDRPNGRGSEIPLEFLRLRVTHVRRLPEAARNLEVTGQLNVDDADGLTVAQMVIANHAACETRF